MKLWRDRLIVIVCFPLLLPFMLLVLAAKRDVQIWKAMKEIWRGDCVAAEREGSK